MLQQIFIRLLFTGMIVFMHPASATVYSFSHEGGNSSIQLATTLMGVDYSIGYFDHFEGEFRHDENSPDETAVSVEIRSGSLDSQLFLFDDKLHGEKYFDVGNYPTIHFQSRKYHRAEGKLEGELSLKGITKNVVLDVSQVGDEGNGKEAGSNRFTGKTVIKATDFDMPAWIGDVEVRIVAEGIQRSPQSENILVSALTSTPGALPADKK